LFGSVFFDLKCVFLVQLIFEILLFFVIIEFQWVNAEFRKSCSKAKATPQE
jgi:hypothetical protein